VANQNITLSLPEEDIQLARVIAVQRRTSVSKLLAGMLKDLVERETGYASAKERALGSLDADYNLGTGGHLTWDRDALHER
jgi:hypothetical protein